MSIVNPLTQKKIKIGGPTYKKLQKEGYFKVNDDVFHGHKPIPKEDLPIPEKKEEYMINPKTNRKIKIGGKIHQQLEREKLGSNFSTKEVKEGAKKEVKEKVKVGLTVKELKEKLSKEGLSTKGLKEELTKRYEEFLISKKEPEKLKPISKGNDACVLPDKVNINLHKKVSPTKKQTQEVISINLNLSSQNSNQQTDDCIICKDTINFENKGFSCHRCHKHICVDCKYQMIQAKCPNCKDNIETFFSPKSRSRQIIKYAEFLKEIEKEKTENDAIIAAELQKQWQNESSNFSKSLKGSKNSQASVNNNIRIKKKVLTRKSNKASTVKMLEKLPLSSEGKAKLALLKPN